VARIGAQALMAVAGSLALLWAACFLTLSLKFSPTYAYRVMVWLVPDVQDLARFPSLPVQASPTPFHFAGPPDPEFMRKLSGIRVNSRTGPVEVADFQAFLRSSETSAFLVLQDDRLLYEGYFNGYNRDSMQTSFSIAKSVTSLLVGFAIAEGSIGGVDDPLRRYVPELGPEHQDLSLRRLLRMESGLRHDVPMVLGVEAPWSDAAQTYYYDNLRELAVKAERIEPPGTRFHYNRLNPILLGMVLERATRKPVTQYLQEKIWTPLGMEYGGTWSVDSEKTRFPKMESSLNYRPIDLLKIGRFVLRGGDWEGTRLLPESWIQISTEPPGDGAHFSRDQDPWIPRSFLDAGGYYAFLWWGYRGKGETPDIFALGVEGQVLYVSRAKRAVLIRQGIHNDPYWWPGVLREVVARM
jgi:CubicO group peptidase (beta-lactamase class C family)